MKKFHPLVGEPYTKLEWPLIRASRVNPNIGMFGMTRTNPDGSPKFHSGVDWLAAPGTPVFAAHNGFVRDAGLERDRVGDRHNRGYGLRVYLSDRSTRTVYAHLSDVAPNVIDAMNIQHVTDREIHAGMLIGWVGRTGNVMDDVSIPTHLHFGVRVSGNWVDPLEWLSE